MAIGPAAPSIVASASTAHGQSMLYGIFHRAKFQLKAQNLKRD
jgi:hypothetical protein